MLPEGRVIAARAGEVVSAMRTDASPAWQIVVHYDGDAPDNHTIVPVPGAQGDFPYVLLFDTYGPHNRFAAGDLLAARIAVPE